MYNDKRKAAAKSALASYLEHVHGINLNKPFNYLLLFIIKFQIKQPYKIQDCFEYWSLIHF